MKTKLSTFDDNLSELIGIILGDGCLYYHKHNDKIQSFLQITLDSRNKQYINYVSTLLKKLLCITPKLRYRKNENTCDIRVFNRKIICFLIYKIGLKTSPKWNRAIIPKQFLKNNKIMAVIRGYFDTDGCITIVNNNGIEYPRIEFKICPSPMQNQFIHGLKQFNFKFGAYHIGKGKIRIQLNGKEQVRKWFELIGSKNDSKKLRFLKYTI